MFTVNAYVVSFNIYPTQLAKYNENGNEIIYTVDEEEVNPNDLLFYTKSIDQETNTITNTYIVNAKISWHIEF